MALHRKEPGETLTAGDWNALAAAVDALERRVQRVDVLSAKIDAMPVLLRARVTAVNGAAPGELAAADTITYDVRPIGADEAGTVKSLRPVIGRPTEGTTKVRAARIGTPCVLARFPDGDGAFENVLLLGETIVFKVC